MSSAGIISEAGPFEELRSKKGYVASLNIAPRPEEAQPQLVKVKSAEYRFDKPKVAELDTQSSRQVGDSEVYMYYFRSNGLWNVIIYMGLQVTWATLGNFPSMYQSSACPLLSV